MRSTMQDGPLTITSLLRHGGNVYADSEVVTATTGGTRREPFRPLGDLGEGGAAGTPGRRGDDLRVGIDVTAVAEQGSDRKWAVLHGAAHTSPPGSSLFGVSEPPSCRRGRHRRSQSGSVPPRTA